MKKFFRHLSFVLLTVVFCIQCQKKDQQPIHEDLGSVKTEILKINKDFNIQITELIQLVEKDTDEKRLQEKFNQLRNTYKKMEWAIEYFLPHSARFINGPALPEIEFEEHTVLDPEGLQVLEELLYPYQPENKTEIVRNLKLLINKTGAIKTNFETISINRDQVFDALRQEVFRISSLSIAGFDTPLSGNHLRELPYALESLKYFLQSISHKTENENYTKITSIIDSAKNILKNNNDKDLFNYADFIADYLNPLGTELLNFKKIEGIKDIEVTTALNKNAANFYSKNAFNPNAFAPGKNFEMSNEKAQLGKQLFTDNLLSKNNDRSCSTCHVPEKAFTDGREKSLSLEGAPLSRNTPSLNYSAFQHGQFWDMRQADLEGQSSDVITNKEEMHGDLKAILVKINAHPDYAKAFKNIYKTGKVETWQLQNALASYIRSLPKFNSNFDEFMRGNKNALTSNQKQGFNLFVGKAKCATCHFLPLFNGTVPPNFTKTEQEVLGTAENANNKKLSGDLGRGKFHATVESLQHSFKTPTLRNINKTAPYMHNGGYQTLQEVMHFYNKGGGKGFGLKVENQTLPEDQLYLSEHEINQLIDFMKSLDDN